MWCYRRSRLRARDVVVVLLLAGTACLDRGIVPVAPKAGRMRLSLRANLQAVGERLDVTVAYTRAASTRVVLANAQFPITGTGQQEFGLSVDIGACLADSLRTPSGPGCALSIDVALRDQQGATIDSTAVAVDAQPGQSASAPSVTLRAPSTLTIVAGDDQLGFPGHDALMPVDVKVVDRTGVPLPRRALKVVALTGGGSGTTQSVLTDSLGIARLTYRLGPNVGANTFSVSLESGGSVAPVTITGTGVAPMQRGLLTGVGQTCLIPVGAPISCWGANVTGWLGNASIVGNGTTTAVALSGAQTFLSLATSTADSFTSQATCGLTAAGQPYCWGVNPSGTLGVSSADTCDVSTFTFLQQPIIACAKTPSPVAGNLTFATIAVSGSRELVNGETPAHACGVTFVGDAFCWGTGTRGELGTGIATSATTPTPVVGNLKFVFVGAGHDFSCGLTADKIIYCWGNNANGQLATGTGQPSLVPVRVASGERFVALAIGAATACALNASRLPFCWGQAFYLNATQGPDITTPTAIANAPALSSLSVGLAHACGIDDAANAYCWGGLGTAASLGDGRLRPSAAAVRVSGGFRFAEVGAGGFQSCGITTGKQLLCWGTNFFNTLGAGANSLAFPSPINVTGAQPGAAATIVANGVSDLGSASVRSTVTNGTSRVTVRVTDASGVAVPGVTVTFATGSGGQVQPTAVATTPSGEASTSWILGATPGAQTLTASASGLSGSPITFTATAVTPGAATRLDCGTCAFATVAGAGASSGFISLRALDANGYVVAGVPVTFTPGRAGIITNPSLPTTLTTDTEGMARIGGWTPDTLARTDTIFARAPGISPVVLQLVTRATTVTALRFDVQPSTTKAGQIVAPAVRVALVDRFGNIDTFNTSSVTLALVGGPTGASLGGTITVKAIDGIATFSDLSVSVAGQGYQLRATSGTLPPVSSTAFTITP